MHQARNQQWGRGTIAPPRKKIRNFSPKAECLNFGVSSFLRLSVDSKEFPISQVSQKLSRTVITAFGSRINSL